MPKQPTQNTWVSLTPDEINLIWNGKINDDLRNKINEAIESNGSEEQKALCHKAVAKYAHNTDDIEVDQNAPLSKSDDGCWVQMWGWIPNEEIDAAEETKPNV